MHIIRLRDPWEVRCVEGASEWIVTRKFHRPTGDEPQAVKLAITVEHGWELAAKLNDSELPADASNAGKRMFSLTDRLRPFNLLELTVAKPEVTNPPKFGSSCILEAELQIE